jgi:hypothetical protein
LFHFLIVFRLLCISRYPPRYLHDLFTQFFSSHPAVSVALPTINNGNAFTQLRILLLNRPTIREYQMASRIVKGIEINPNQEVDDPLVRARLKKQCKFDKNLIIRYTYEKRLQSN